MIVEMSELHYTVWSEIIHVWISKLKNSEVSAGFEVTSMISDQNSTSQSLITK